MARRNDSDQDARTPSRVFKSSDVHKRRVDRKGNPKSSGAPREDLPLQPSAGLQESQDQRVQRGSQNLCDQQKSQDAGYDGPSGVVITPDFGERKKARHESDNRWFAAMRESDLLIRRNLAESVPNIEEALSAQGGDEGEQGTASETPATDQTSIGQSDADAHMGPEADRQSGFQSPAQSDSSKMQQAQQPSELPEQPSDQQQEKTACALQDDWEPDSSGEEPSPVSRPGFGFLPTTLKGRIFLAVGLVVLAAIVVGSAYFMWDRWYRYDDHADLQGEWYVLGTTVPVTIDDSTIHLTDDVTYQYVINDRDKTIQYTFGRMEGKGRYWFSDDRQYLVITDGDEFTSSGTAFDDLIRTFSELPDRVSGNEVKLPEGEGIIVFSRTPDPDALARQQADAAAKVAAEEAARKEAERKAAEEAESEEYYYEEEPADDAPTGDAPAEEQSAEGESAEGDSAAEEPVEKERAEEG